MNPYRSQTATAAEPARRAGVKTIATGILLIPVALYVASPGLLYLAADHLRPRMPSRRYATYDVEIFLFGFSVSETTAKIMTLAIAPVIFFVAATCFYVGWSARSTAERTLPPATNPTTDPSDG